jgi:hypothetical protein
MKSNGQQDILYLPFDLIATWLRMPGNASDLSPPCANLTAGRRRVPLAL